MSKRKRIQPDDKQISEPQAGDGSDLHPFVQRQPRQPQAGSIVADGERYQELANGAIYDHAVKRIVANPPGGPATGIKSHSQAVALATARWQKAAAAGRAGLRRAALSGKTAYAGWEDIVYTRSKHAMDPKAQRDGVEAARFVGQATGFLRDRQAGSEPPATGATMQISSELGLAIAEMLASRQREGERSEDE